MALRSLGVQVDHLFSCDVNPHVKATIMANFPPRVFYDDIMTRDNSTAPKADLYVAGFPCQPFSSAGLGQGFGDKQGRGTIFFKVRDYISEQQPKAFILENVAGLTQLDQGRYFAAILESLAELKTYHVYAKLLDTKEHGLPQSRKRVYIVGIHKVYAVGTFEFPEPVERPSIEMFLEPRVARPHPDIDLPPARSSTARANVIKTLRELRERGHDPLSEPWIIDCDSSGYRMSCMQDISPCLTCSRAAGHWITNRGRRMTKDEQMNLQGMASYKPFFRRVVSESQLGKQIGNAMSVNVLERLLVRLLPAAGLVSAAAGRRLQDRWAPAPAPITPPRQIRSRQSRTISSSRTPSPRPKRRRLRLVTAV